MISRKFFFIVLFLSIISNANSLCLQFYNFKVAQADRKQFLEIFRSELESMLKTNILSRSLLENSELTKGWNRKNPKDIFYVLKLSDDNYYAFKEQGFGLFKTRLKRLNDLKTGMYDMSNGTIADVYNSLMNGQHLYIRTGKESAPHVLDSEIFDATPDQKREFIDKYRVNLILLLDTGRLTKSLLKDSIVTQARNVKKPSKVFHVLLLPNDTQYVFGSSRSGDSHVTELRDLSTGVYIMANGYVAHVSNNLNGMSATITTPDQNGSNVLTDFFK